MKFKIAFAHFSILFSKISSNPDNLCHLNFESRKNFYRQRTRLVQDRCLISSAVNKSTKTTLKDILQSSNNVSLPLIVDATHKIIYCEIPKASSTNWKRTLIKLSNPEKYRDVKNIMAIRNPRKSQHYDLKYLSDFSLEEQLKMLNSQNYFKFTFVRHPLDRLLSAYKDKAAEDFRGKHGEKVFKFYSQSGQMDKFLKYDIESFHKFLQFVLAQGNNHDHNNSNLNQKIGIKERHWTPYSKLCHFCSIEYDFIGKLESVVQDAAYLLEFWKKDGRTSDKIDGKLMYPAVSSMTDRKLVEKYFEGIDKETLSEIYSLFADDFELFDYH